MSLRRRVLNLLKGGYSVRRSQNIIFVCGGNESHHMREKFSQFCKANHHDLEIFKPEYALPSYFGNPIYSSFDIADFEKIIGELSHAIVLFPEAAGSYAELGYFAAVPSLAEKTILALDAKYQGQDSFISMGPARKLDEASAFSASVQISYDHPDFSTIVNRINRLSISNNRKHLDVVRYKSMSSYEIFCIIYQIINLLRACTKEDIIFILSGLFRTHFSKTKSMQLLSVLVGSGYIEQTGEFGQYTPKMGKKSLLVARDGFATEEASTRLEIALLLPSSVGTALEVAE